MAYQTGNGSAGLTALLRPPSHGTVDFLGFARGAAIGDELNWRDQLREQDQIRLRRSVQDEDDERRARTYMASMLTNMQTAASAGVDPTDYFIQQREQMMADPAFQSMNAETQHMVINRMGQSVALQLQALKNAGDMRGARRLADSFGLTYPTNDAMLAGAAGNYAQQIDAINQMYGSDIQLSPDGQTVSMNGMSMPAHAAISVLNSLGNRPESLQNAMFEWNMKADQMNQWDQALAQAGLNRWGMRVDGQQPGAPVVPGMLGAQPAVPGAQPAAPGAQPAVPGAQPAMADPTRAVSAGVQRAIQYAPVDVTFGQQVSAMNALTANPWQPPYDAIQQIRASRPWQAYFGQRPGDTGNPEGVVFGGQPGSYTRGPFTFQHLPTYTKPTP